MIFHAPLYQYQTLTLHIISNNALHGSLIQKFIYFKNFPNFRIMAQALPVTYLFELYFK